MIKFLLGESRQLKFEVSNKQYPEFQINSATYDIIKDNRIVESDDMDVSNHIISMTFTPEERGFYWLEITYAVGPDTLKSRYKIDVD